MSTLLGQILANRYRVDTFLGRGGMAEVYKVWDNQRMVFLAMKVLHQDMAEDKIFLRRFRREAQTLSKLEHPHIVRFHGLEQDGRTAFMLMEYVDGLSLRTMIFDAGTSLPLGHIKEIMHAVCGALYYAHHKGMVHCDIKPANIMLDRHGGVRLADFGIARMTDGATATMVGAGTPAYMAPEQIRGKNPVPQTDIYALGVVLFEMLTGGERPFTGEQAQSTGSTGEKVRWEHLNLHPPSPRKWNPSISSPLEAVVMKCLSKNPAQRFDNTLELFNELGKAIGHAPTVALKESVATLYPSIALQGQPKSAGRQKKTSSKKKLNSFFIGGTAIVLVGILFFLVQVFATKTHSFSPSPAPIQPTWDFATNIASTLLPASSIPPIPPVISTPIALPTYTPYPTLTPYPILPPTFTPTLPSRDVNTEVEEFIRNYWTLVSNKNFATAYEYQSAGFKKRNQPNGLESFITGFQYTEKVTISNANAISVSSNTATVDADVTFYSTAGTTSFKKHRYTLIVESGHWVIDSAVNR